MRQCGIPAKCQGHGVFDVCQGNPVLNRPRPNARNVRKAFTRPWTALKTASPVPPVKRRRSRPPLDPLSRVLMRFFDFLGQYANETGSTQCFLCEPGSYQNVRASSFCVACDAGTFSAQAGSFECSTCTGVVILNGAGCLTKNCSIGTAPAEMGCTACSPGRYSSSCESCEPCGTRERDHLCWIVELLALRSRFDVRRCKHQCSRIADGS